MQRVLHSNLSARIILDIRATSAAYLEDNEPEISTIKCASLSKSRRDRSGFQPESDHHGMRNSSSFCHQILSDNRIPVSQGFPTTVNH